MFYISKISPLLFILAFFNFIVSIFLKINGSNYFHIGIVAVFGFISLTLIGAMYQIIPNSQQEKLKNEFISYIVFFVAILLSIFLWVNNVKISSFLFLGLVILFLVNIIPVLKIIKPITIRYLLVSIIYFLFAAIFFVLSSLNLVSIQFAIHTLTVGVLINAVLGVQTAWFPLFFMQNLDFKKSIWIFYLVQISTLLILSSFFLMDYKLIGLASLIEIIAIFLFILQMVVIVKKGKMIQKIPYAVKLFSVGHLFLFLGLLSAFFMSTFKRFDFLTIHFDFMVYGFAFFTVIGGVLHLTPRILWNMVSVKKAQEGKQVPQLNKLLDGNTVDRFNYFLVGLFGISLLLEISLKSNLYWGFFLIGVVITFFKFLWNFYKFYKY